VETRQNETQCNNKNVEGGVEGHEFLRKMRAGDSSVWESLMPALHKVAVGACRDLKVFDQRKDDIVQDVALKVFTHWESYQGDSKLNTWIYSIARNRCLDELRRQRVRNETRDSAQDGEDGLLLLDRLVDETQSDMEHRLCVQEVLAELDSHPPARKGSMRMIDVLRWWVENTPSTEELADFLRTSVGAAKERKSYILKHVRALCQKYCGQDECAFSRSKGS
jgi:RNA polymerase sigma factor (sigma-70 family)